MRVLLIANYEDKGGGISVQVRLLCGFLRNDGFFCDIISTKGSIVKRVKAIFALLSKGRDYDVFHIHACSDWGFLPVVIGYIIGHLFRKRIICTFHGGGAESFFHKRQRFVKFFLTRISANIVLSKFIGRVFERYEIPYTIIPNILEIDDSAYRVRTGILPRYISIRSLSETYNIKCTLKAFLVVQKKYPKASLTLRGDGPLKSELEQYVTNNSLQNVTFVGRVSNSEIYQYLDDADILVSSSRFDNMPVSILEGFKAGLLVISSRVGGVPYMIEDGKNGLLFDSDDDGQMAEKMITAVEHPEATLRMIENAHHCLDAYKWENCREKMLALYKG